MTTVLQIPATYMRGGTSKGVFINIDDLPPEAREPGKFRDREFEVLSNLKTEDNCVISTGGGIVLRKENRKLLKKGTVIYLETSIQSQLERTMNDRDRPLLQGVKNKEETLRGIATLRNPLYLKCSDIVISETNDLNECVDCILREIGQLK